MPLPETPEDERGRLEDTVGRSKGWTEASWASGLSDFIFLDPGRGASSNRADFDSSWGADSPRTSSCVATRMSAAGWAAAFRENIFAHIATGFDRGQKDTQWDCAGLAEALSFWGQTKPWEGVRGRGRGNRRCKWCARRDERSGGGDEAPDGGRFERCGSPTGTEDRHRHRQQTADSRQKIWTEREESQSNLSRISAAIAATAAAGRGGGEAVGQTGCLSCLVLSRLDCGSLAETTPSRYDVGSRVRAHRHRVIRKEGLLSPPPLSPPLLSPPLLLLFCPSNLISILSWTGQALPLAAASRSIADVSTHT